MLLDLEQYTSNPLLHELNGAIRLTVSHFQSKLRISRIKILILFKRITLLIRRSVIHESCSDGHFSGELVMINSHARCEPWFSPLNRHSPRCDAYVGSRLDPTPWTPNAIDCLSHSTTRAVRERLHSKASRVRPRNPCSLMDSGSGTVDYIIADGLRRTHSVIGIFLCPTIWYKFYLRLLSASWRGHEFMGISQLSNTNSFFSNQLETVCVLLPSHSQKVSPHLPESFG
jgi:hypothetical protein